MGKTDPDGPAYKQQSMLVVPLDTPGVRIVRGLYGLRLHGTARATPKSIFEDVRVPASALLAGEGDGFMISPGAARPRPDPPLHALDRDAPSGRST